MTTNADGSATCDRCGIYLPGYGVVHGMITTDIDEDGILQQRIFCYRNQCRSAVLEGMLVFPGQQRTRCPHCGVAVTASVAEAMLTADLTVGGETRMLAFCYFNGSRDILLSHSHL